MKWLNLSGLTYFWGKILTVLSNHNSDASAHGLDDYTPSTEHLLTLTAAGWTGSAPFSQDVTVTGLDAASKGVVGVAGSASAAQRAAARDAQLSPAGQSANTLTIVADGDKPAVDIPLALLEIK